MVINVLAAPGCLSEGEALRFVAQEDIVKGDFVLVSGSVLGNADLLPAMQAHAARRNADRQALMTLLLHCQSSSATMLATISGTCMVAADPCSKQLLRLEQCWTRGTTSLGTHIFGERNAVAVRAGCTVCWAPCMYCLIHESSMAAGAIWLSTVRRLYLCARRFGPVE
jgi:translation initiation factor eIF-2B subunit epsilon